MFKQPTTTVNEANKLKYIYTVQLTILSTLPQPYRTAPKIQIEISQP
jgi:hypothetical protein